MSDSEIDASLRPLSDDSAESGQSGGCGDGNAACCANFYEQDIVQELMGGSFHPGGEGLSRRLVESLGLPEGARVLDVACGVGTTTRMMATDFGLNATGLDFSKINVQKAAAASHEKPIKKPTEADVPTEGNAQDSSADSSQDCCDPGTGCCGSPGLASLDSSATIASSANQDRDSATPSGGSAQFLHGSADAIPMDDAALQGLTCECAVSTFADQPLVAAEFFRVLKSGGVFGMTDMVLNGILPDDFSEKAAPWTCVAKAMTVEGYQRLFTDAGFEVVATEDHSHTLLELAKDMKRKLVMAGMGKALGALPSLGMSFSEMRSMLAQSTELVNSGTIEYGLLVFRKP